MPSRAVAAAIIAASILTPAWADEAKDKEIEALRAKVRMLEGEIVLLRSQLRVAQNTIDKLAESNSGQKATPRKPVVPGTSPLARFAMAAVRKAGQPENALGNQPSDGQVRRYDAAFIKAFASAKARRVSFEGVVKETQEGGGIVSIMVGVDDATAGEHGGFKVVIQDIMVAVDEKKHPNASTLKKGDRIHVSASEWRGYAKPLSHHIDLTLYADSATYRKTTDR